MKIKLQKIVQNTLLSSSLATALIASGSVFADEYAIDKKGAHASIQFKISHLGYSWMWGRFNDFDGTFSYDEKDKSASKINVTLHGVTKEVDVAQVGAGKDPWGGFRRGFEGRTRIALKDFGITKNLGPASAELDLIFEFEGIKQK